MRTQMRIFKEVKKIANKMSQIHQLIKKLENNPHFDAEGLEWESVEFVSGLQEKKDGLYKNGRRIAKNGFDYYCAQTTGFCEDDYYGWVYFKTDVPGQFVKVFFHM